MEERKKICGIKRSKISLENDPGPSKSEKISRLTLEVERSHFGRNTLATCRRATSAKGKKEQIKNSFRRTR